MDHQRDEAHLMGQIAGIIAMMSAIVQALPPSTRKRLVPQLHAQFESLIAAMSATGVTEATAGRKGAVWVRDLFLRQIAKANKKNKGRKASPPATEDELDIQL